MSARNGKPLALPFAYWAMQNVGTGPQSLLPVRL